VFLQNRPERSHLNSYRPVRGVFTSGNREIVHTPELTRYEKGTISSPRKIKYQQKGKDDELSPENQRRGRGENR
jgi:hypothetical protein